MFFRRATKRRVGRNALRRNGAFLIFALAAAGVVLVGFASQAWSSAADLDPTFGGGAGVVTTDFGGTDDQGFAVAIQPDGHIVVAGGLNLGGDLDSDDFALARYDPAGNLDAAFGTGGRVITDFGTNRDEAKAVAIQGDGRIVAAGWNAFDFQLARYNVDGTLDTTFSDDGKLTTDLGGGDFADAVAIQADGKIIAAGGTGAYFAITRYTPSGALDSTFDGDGKLTTDFGGGSAASAVALQPDGKIVAAGRAPCDPTCRDFALARYNPDGSLDAGFDGDGKLTTDFGGPVDAAFDVAVQADGKIIAVGRGGPAGFAIARYNSDGSLDPSFDGDGKAIVAGMDGAEALALRSDGTIIAAGGVWRGDDKGNFALARLSPDGSLDPTFSLDGRIEDDFGGTHDRVMDLALQPDGKIVAGGFSGPLGEFFSGDFAVARYLPDGEPDAIPPETEIGHGPPTGSATRSTEATFTFGGLDNIVAGDRLTFTCSLDGSAFTSCVSPVTYSGLADGVHRFAVQARDPSGNVDATPATRAWTVDTAPPETALTGMPPRLMRRRSASFSFSAVDAATPAANLAFECTLDGGPPAPCSSPHAIVRLSDGQHTFAVRAIDSVGNRDATAADFRWTVDATPPAKPRVRGPRRTANRRPAYRFSSADAITRASELRFRCRVDSRRLRRCGSRYRVRLSVGRHVLSVVAVDEAGNVSPVVRIPIVIQRR